MPKIKITRTRTCQQRLNSEKFQQNFAHLREILSVEPITASTSPPKAKGRGRGKGKRGVRLGAIGGSPLTSTMAIDDTDPAPTTATVYRSFGQTCQPKSADKHLQVIRCVRCDGVGHDVMTCTANNTLPQTMYCKACIVKKKTYSSNDNLSLEITLCPAHVRDVQFPDGKKKEVPESRKKEAATFLLEKVYKLVHGGTPLTDAIMLMGLTVDKFNKYKLLVN